MFPFCPPDVARCPPVDSSLFNVMFHLFSLQISGCIILGVSIYLKVSKHDNKDTLPAVDLMIAIGVIIMVLGFLGCCGAIRENRCMLLLVSFSWFFLHLCFLSGSLQSVDWVKERSCCWLLFSGSDFWSGRFSFQLKCCGLVNGPADWQTSVPPSCRCNATSTEVCSGMYYNTVRTRTSEPQNLSPLSDGNDVRRKPT
uniref:Tetraspanin-8-like n=1 Tax=Stegastes partitus TaxID=144197 RepID=A0A3B5ALL5_9TELE